MALGAAGEAGGDEVAVEVAVVEAHVGEGGEHGAAHAEGVHAQPAGLPEVPEHGGLVDAALEVHVEVADVQDALVHVDDHGGAGRSVDGEPDGLVEVAATQLEDVRVRVAAREEDLAPVGELVVAGWHEAGEVEREVLEGALLGREVDGAAREGRAAAEVDGVGDAARAVDIELAVHGAAVEAEVAPDHHGGPARELPADREVLHVDLAAGGHRAENVDPLGVVAEDEDVVVRGRAQVEVDAGLAAGQVEVEVAGARARPADAGRGGQGVHGVGQPAGGAVGGVLAVGALADLEGRAVVRDLHVGARPVADAGERAREARVVEPVARVDGARWHVGAAHQLLLGAAGGRGGAVVGEVDVDVEALARVAAWVDGALEAGGAVAVHDELGAAVKDELGVDARQVEGVGGGAGGDAGVGRGPDDAVARLEAAGVLLVDLAVAVVVDAVADLGRARAGGAPRRGWRWPPLRRRHRHGRPGHRRRSGRSCRFPGSRALLRRSRRRAGPGREGP